MSDILTTFDIIEFVRVWVVDVYAQDFPVRLSIVDHGQDSQDFDLDDRPPGMNRPTYLDHVNRVVVTTNASAAINVARVLPSLSKKDTCTIVLILAIDTINLGFNQQMVLPEKFLSFLKQGEILSLRGNISRQF